MTRELATVDDASAADGTATGHPNPGTGPPARRPWTARLAPYVRIARPRHWLKNVIVLAGAGLALFYRNAPVGPYELSLLLWGVLAVCCMASGNYVINEILDAPRDRNHPWKEQRPLAARSASRSVAYAQWVGLAVLGLAIAAAVNKAFFATGCLFVGGGLAYNIPPLRLKDRAYLDVLSEGTNSPLRLLFGWFLLIPDALPDLSLMLGAWLAGASAMAVKRLMELRHIGDKETAAAYRKSFAHYDEMHLKASVAIYTAAAAVVLVAWGAATFLAAV